MSDTYGAIRTAAAVCMLSGALLAGCAGPSTRVLPQDNGGGSYETPEEIPVLEEVNPFYLQEELEVLTASPRPTGRRGESDAARYIEQLLTDYGYQVERQRFRIEGDPAVTGTNVEAVRRAPSPDADILLITTHHDTVRESPGANDNASGVTAMLEVARLVSKLPTDTELRFVSFSGGEGGRLGARRYVEDLTKRERERMVGAVNLDALGYVSGGETVLGTLDGGNTMLGDMLKDAASDVLEERWQYGRRGGGSVSALIAGQIPAVSVGQRDKAFEAGTPFDTVSTVDIERVSQVVDVVSQAVFRVISADTPSMTAKAHYINDLWDNAFVQEKDDPFLFGDDLAATEAQTGQTGVLAAVNTDASGAVIRKYEFRMKWFGVDQIILSDYYFLDGKLDTISLEADGAGIDFEDMAERLTSVYGDPERLGETPDGVQYQWTDPAYRKLFVLTPVSGGYDMEIRQYETPQTVLSRQSAGGTASGGDGEPGGDGGLPADGRIPKIMDLLTKILPQGEAAPITAVTFITDGFGGEDVFLTPVQALSAEDIGQAPGGEAQSGQGQGGQAPGARPAGAGQAAGGNGGDKADGEEENPAPLLGTWELSVDPQDVMAEDGSWRDRTGFICQVVGLYGQILEQARPDVYGAAFHEAFDGEGQALPEARVGVAPGEPVQEQLPLPGFADSFILYVLTDRDDGQPGSIHERVGYFNKFGELNAYRSQVRGNLQLHSQPYRATALSSWKTSLSASDMNRT